MKYIERFNSISHSKMRFKNRSLAEKFIEKILLIIIRIL